MKKREKSSNLQKIRKVKFKVKIKEKEEKCLKIN